MNVQYWTSLIVLGVGDVCSKFTEAVQRRGGSTALVAAQMCRHFGVNVASFARFRVTSFPCETLTRREACCDLFCVSTLPLRRYATLRYALRPITYSTVFFR